MKELIDEFLLSWGRDSPEYGIIWEIFVYVLFILVYSGFFWKFHKLISRKEFLIFNLEKYSDYENQVFGRFMIFILMLLSYFIIIPALLIFWFFAFSVSLFILTKNIEIASILLISASFIISIRIMAYSQEDISRNIAKILPFTVLAMFVINPSFLNLSQLAEKIMQVPEIMQNSFFFLWLIFISEIVLRIFTGIPNIIKHVKGSFKDNNPKKNQKRKSYLKSNSKTLISGDNK